MARHKPYIRICTASSGKAYLRYVPCNKHEIEEKISTAAEISLPSAIAPRLPPPAKGTYYGPDGKLYDNGVVA